MNQQQAALIVQLGLTDEQIGVMFPDAGPKWYGLIREWGARGGQMLVGGSPISYPFFSNPSEDYRLAPRTVTITGPGGTFELPEPVREEPEHGAQYWIVDMTGNNPVALLTWNGQQFDTRALSRGLCHATRENAQAHADALAKLMQKEVKP